MKTIIMNHHLIINSSSLLLERFLSFEMIHSALWIFHSTNSIIFQSSLVSLQTMHSFSIHRRNSRRHRSLLTHHMNRITMITDRSKNLNIVLEPSAAFKMRFERIVNAIKILLSKWCICQMMHSSTFFHQIVVHLFLTLKSNLLMRFQINSCSSSHRISMSILTTCISSRLYLIEKSCSFAMIAETITATSIIKRFLMIIILFLNWIMQNRSRHCAMTVKRKTFVFNINTTLTTLSFT